MDTHHQTVLPPEIWLHILNDVVQSDHDPRADEHKPFQPPPDLRRGTRVALAAQLVRVCRAWYELLLPLLCTDVQLGGGPIPLPHCVRRVVLPYVLTTPNIHYDSTAIVDHLRQCTQVETLCRPAAMGERAWDVGPPAVALPSLKKLEWCCTLSTGGIHSLEDTLSQCPNLRYLFVTGFTEISLPAQEAPANVPTLETLRLRYQNDSFISRLLGPYWSLPSLKTVILDTSPTLYRSMHCLFWNKFGGNVTRVELGQDIAFSRNDYLSACLDGCPALQELGYYPFFITHQMPHPGTHYSLKRVRLHAAPNDDLSQSETWAVLHRHIFLFNSPGMHKLSTFVLHHNWTPFTRDARWDDINGGITAQGREIILDMEHETTL